MLGGKIGAVGLITGSGVGLLGGIFGGRSKKPDEMRRERIQADIDWARRQLPPSVSDEVRKLRAEIRALRETVAAMNEANAMAGKRAASR